jgi:hypothetical protein
LPDTKEVYYYINHSYSNGIDEPGGSDKVSDREIEMLKRLYFVFSNEKR